MESILTEVVKAVIVAAIGYLCWLVKKKWSPSAVNTLVAIVPLAVQAIEQIAKRSKFKGEKKLEEALDLVEDTFEAEMNRQLSFKERPIAQMLIEAAVKELFPKVKK